MRAPSPRASFHFLILFFITAPALAESPAARIDLHFIDHPSVIQRPSPAATDAYVRDVSDPRRHPTFAREVSLDFGDREVRAFLIASRHDGEADLRFIRESLERLGVSSAATLFIEQGDGFAPDGAVTQLRTLVRERAPGLTNALDEAARKKISFLNPALLAKSPFLLAAREWTARGGHVVNFDATANFSEEAVRFLAKNLGHENALRFLREELHGETLSLTDFRELVARVYGANFTAAEIASFPDCCANMRTWAHEIAADFPLRDRVRERFMRLRLARGLRDGDVIITHPVHMDHLLGNEIL